ncbi:MAG: hypothetical protein HC817_11895 [Saprospiraceae bacterium]|nr:hypothetical protein [Saprospiraceae bacterium]
MEKILWLQIRAFRSTIAIITARKRNINLRSFFLDRAIYRPGQTVFFKALALEKNEKGIPRIMPDMKIIITFLTKIRQKIADKELITNEFGTVSGSFVTPTGGSLGRMSLQSSIEGNHYFSVEEYKRPKFEVKIAPLEGTFVLNQNVTVKGNAKAFAGSNIDGAKVSYRVVREVRFPYWSWRWNPWHTEGGKKLHTAKQLPMHKAISLFRLKPYRIKVFPPQIILFLIIKFMLISRI